MLTIKDINLAFHAHQVKKKENKSGIKNKNNMGSNDGDAMQ